MKLLTFIRTTLLFTLIAVSCKSISATDLLTGSWHGTLLDKPIELALWPVRRDTGSDWLQWEGYFYAPYNDCYMAASISYKAEQTSINFTAHGINGRKHNCMKNLQGGRSQFKSGGRFDLLSLPNKLHSSFDFLMFNGYASAPDETVSMILKPGIISPDMVNFVQQYKHNYFKQPTSHDLAKLSGVKYANSIPPSSGGHIETAVNTEEGAEIRLAEQSKELAQKREKAKKEAQRKHAAQINQLRNERKKAHLASSKKQLNKPSYEILDKPPAFPPSIKNFYLINEGGSVSVIQDNAKKGNNKLNSYSELRSKFQIDGGIIKDQYYGWKKYTPSKGLIYNQNIDTRVKGKLARYCKTLKKEPYYTWLKPYQLPNKKYINNLWKVVPDNPKGICDIAMFTSRGCKVEKCTEYSYSESLVTPSKKIAYEIARKRQEKEKTSYKEAKARLDKMNATNPITTNKRPKSYEESGGLCGNISCMQQDLDFALEW